MSCKTCGFETSHEYCEACVEKFSHQGTPCFLCNKSEGVCLVAVEMDKLARLGLMRHNDRMVYYSPFTSARVMTVLSVDPVMKTFVGYIDSCPGMDHNFEWQDVLGHGDKLPENFLTQYMYAQRLIDIGYTYGG